MLNHIVANRCHYRLGMAPGTVPQQVCSLTHFLCLLFIHKWYSGSKRINLQNVLPIRESMILASSQNNESTNKSKEKTKQWKEIEERKNWIGCQTWPALFSILMARWVAASVRLLSFFAPLSGMVINAILFGEHPQFSDGLVGARTERPIKGVSIEALTFSE